MVQKIIAGMRRLPTRWLAVIGLLAIALVTAVHMRTASATVSFISPLWSDGSPSPACACDNCACIRPSELTAERVSKRTGEYFAEFYLFSIPGKLGDVRFSLMWGSMISGETDFGHGIVPSFMHSLQIGTGDSPVYWRRPDGLIVTYTKSGSTWSTTDCNVHTTLTKPSGLFALTGVRGDVLNFDANGMLASSVDRHNNTTTVTYDSSLRWTGYTDDRGQSLTIHHNAYDYVDWVQDAAGRTWSFGYDSYGNLHTITTPTTPDQSSGVTTTLSYDGYNRLTSTTDGRSNTVNQYAYVGSSGQIDHVTIDGNDPSYSYASGVTSVTDREGNVERWSYSGQTITQHDWWISGAATYPTVYRYIGSDLVNIVYPRGNRLDITYDGNGNITEKRRKTTDTNTNSSTDDIIDSWAFSSNFVSSYTDPLGNTTSYTRNAKHDVIAISYPSVSSPTSQTGVGRSFSVNGSGQVTLATDEEGKTVGNTYFTSGSSIYLLQKSEVNPSGLDLTTTYAYDSAGNVNSVTDPRGNATTTTWDDLRRRVEVATPSPIQILTDYHYDGNGNVTEVDVENRDKDNASVSGNAWWTTTSTYTATDRLASVTEEIDSTHTRTTSFDYDKNDRRIRVTKPEGNKEKWTYNARGLVATHIRGETDTNASTESYAYDDNGNLTVVTDGRGHDTTIAYDLFDRRTRTTNALSNYTAWTLDKAGNTTEEARKDSSDVTLQRRSYAYDERNRLYQTSDLYKDPSATYSDAERTTQRNKTGRVATVTNARSKNMTYAYDNAWRRTSATDAMGNVVSSTLDGSGNETARSITEYDGGTAVTHSYSATFDVLNRRTESDEIDRTNSSNVLATTYAYDSHGDMAWQVNAEGNPTRWTYDGLSRMTKKEVALAVGSPITTFTAAQDTQWGFDKNNRLVSFKDDAGNESTWAYDALDRKTTMTYPGGSQTVAFVYDANDNVTQLTDPGANVVTDTFDYLNRNTARSVSLGTGFLDTTSETRSYDALNRMTLNQNDYYKLEYTFGVLGLSSGVYEEKQSYVAGSAYLRTVTTKFDEVGNLTSQVYPTSLALARSYNDVNRLSSISDGTNTIASYSYVGLRGKVTTFQNGATETDSYTGFRDEIAEIDHQTSAPATIVDLQYGYNKVHDRTFERFGASGASGDAVAYDKMRRVSTAYVGSSTPSNPTGSGVTYVSKTDYNMDDNGNRTSVVVTPWGQSASTTNFTTNGFYEYSAVGGTSRSHDPSGSVTDDGTYKYEYNYMHLIARVKLKSNNTLVATYKYDANGRRVEKAVSGGSTERYVYSGVERIATYDGANAWKQNFAFGDGTDQIVMIEEADILDYDSDSDVSEITRCFYHRGSTNSVMAITSASQTVACEYRYSPYGKVTITRNGSQVATDPLGQHLTFTARFLDEEIGLCDFRAREYSPDDGRFLGRDPLGVKPGANLYEYVNSSPVSAVDPFGLEGVAAGFEDGFSASHVEAEGGYRRTMTPRHPDTMNPYDETIESRRILIGIYWSYCISGEITPDDASPGEMTNCAHLCVVRTMYWDVFQHQVRTVHWTWTAVRIMAISRPPGWNPLEDGGGRATDAVLDTGVQLAGEGVVTVGGSVVGGVAGYVMGPLVNAAVPDDYWAERIVGVDAHWKRDFLKWEDDGAPEYGPSYFLGPRQIVPCSQVAGLPTCANCTPNGSARK